jgi:hypothetical protein
MSTAGAQRMSKEGRKKQKVYVMPEPGKRAIFMLYDSTFQKREISLTWYMTWVIRPLHGIYRTIPSLYDFYGITYTADQLRDYYVILAIPITPENKGLGEQWKGKKVVIWGYQDEEVLIE